jgi:glycosyltransferase involved in cell wall biosynthesis
MNINNFKVKKTKMKVLFITGKLQHYRIPIFNIISQKVDLTVAHSGVKLTNEMDASFKEIIIKENKIGPFTYHENLTDLANNFDVVVAMLYLQKLSFMRLLFARKTAYKLIYWGIGVKASQKSKFDAPTVLNYVRYYIAKRCDAMIFYTDYARKKYIARGIKKEKLFVMNNTVAVIDTLNEKIERNKIIFIGSFNKSKKIFSLLEAYLEASKISEALLKIELVGDGVDFEDVKQWVSDNQLGAKIKIHGAIYNPEELERIYKSGIVSISPGQAGLSVLSCFGYGVPFVTSSNAITGGERLNIKNNFNGILFNSDQELKNIIIDISNNQTKYLKMGENAKNYYLAGRTPEIMADGFLDAINYTQKLN